MSEPNSGTTSRIVSAINSADQSSSVDQTLRTILEAIDEIDPALMEAAARLTVDDIGTILADFHNRAVESVDETPGNTPEQTTLALVAMSEAKRRADLDGTNVLEWCRRKRIKGFVND